MPTLHFVIRAQGHTIKWFNAYEVHEADTRWLMACTPDLPRVHFCPSSDLPAQLGLARRYCRQCGGTIVVVERDGRVIQACEFVDATEIEGDEAAGKFIERPVDPQSIRI